MQPIELMTLQIFQAKKGEKLFVVNISVNVQQLLLGFFDFKAMRVVVEKNHPRHFFHWISNWNIKSMNVPD